MTVKELIDALSHVPDNTEVYCDMDDYPFVASVRRAADYDGPPDYAPPEGCVLLVVDFPK